MIERLNRLAPPGGRLRRWGVPIAAWLFFLALPFLILWRFAPGAANTIGNDYVIYPIDAQLEYVWSWGHGIVPLFMPGFAGGASASAMTLGQAWHPITWLCALTPGFRTGGAELVVTFYRFLELGITHRLLYAESRARGLERAPAFIFTIAVVFNERMLDSFRYGASLESYCGMLLSCHAFSLAHRLGWTPRRIAWSGFSLYLTLVGGHPQWALFGVGGAVLFGLALLTVAPVATTTRLRYLGGSILGGCVGGGLAAGYLFPFAGEFLRQNAGRVGQDYAFTAGFSDTVRGTLANLFRPLESDVHGAFGSTILPLLLLAYAVVALVGSRRPWTTLVPALAIALTILFALGKTTPFHRLVVEHIPGFSSFRVPGRANLMIPPLLLALAWAAWSGDRAEERRRFFRVPMMTVAAALALVLHLVFQALVPTIRVTPYSPLLFNGGPGWTDAALVVLFAVTALTLGVAALRRPGASDTAWVVCVVAVVASAAIALPFGTWRAKRKPTRTFQELDAHHAKNLSFWGDPGFGMEPKAVLRAREVGLSLARPRGQVFEHWKVAGDEEEAAGAAAKGGGPFLTGPSVSPREGEGSRPRAAKIRSVNWNRWRFGVDAPGGGVFVFGHPALPQWRATVDGAAVPVVTADGTFPAVVVEPGQHEVELRFVSIASVAGAAISALTVLAIIVVRHRIRGRKTMAARATTCGLALLVVIVLALFGRGLWPDWDMRDLANDSAQRPES